MSPARWRIIPYLVLAVLVLVPSFWSGQDAGGWLIAGSFAVVGLVLVWQRPREVVGWILLGMAVAFSAVGSALPGSASQVVDGQADAGITAYAWFSSWTASLFFGLFVALAALFPSGRFAPGRLGLAGRIAVAIPLGFSAVLAFAPTWTVSFIDGSTADVRLPFPFMPDWPGWPVLSNLVYLGVLAALVLSIGTLIVRFRRARGTERAQYKWLLAALAATLATVVFAFVAILLVDEDGTWMWWPAVLTYPTIPVGIGVAVRRYRLYDIDRVVSRSVSYLVVTGLLAAVFGGMAILLQALLADLTQGETLAVAASTLAALILFQPVRGRVQATVDRRFDRARVDAQRAIDGLVGRLRDELDLDALEGAVVAAAGDAVRPASAGVWLREATKRPPKPVS